MFHDLLKIKREKEREKESENKSFMYEERKKREKKKISRITSIITNTYAYPPYLS